MPRKRISIKQAELASLIGSRENSNKKLMIFHIANSRSKMKKDRFFNGSCVKNIMVVVHAVLLICAKLV